MNTPDNFKSWYALSLAWQLGFLIALPLAGFLWLGVLIDKHFQTHPLFIIIGLIVGVVITIHGVYHLINPLIKKTRHD